MGKDVALLEAGKTYTIHYGVTEIVKVRTAKTNEVLIIADSGTEIELPEKFVKSFKKAETQYLNAQKKMMEYLKNV